MARQCLVEGCGRLVRPGKVICRAHGKTVFGRIVAEEGGGVSQGGGFAEEREALRAALWRVMGEEDVDVVKLAHAVSRLVGTTVRAARAEERVRKAGGVEG